MSTFHFKNFALRQTNSVLKVGTDAMILGAFIETENRIKGLDIGTGTGVLALMQAQKSRDLHITAIDIDKLSCEDAKFNFENSQFANQFALKEIDFLEFSSNQKFDLIFSNPPYYQNTLKGENDNLNLAKHVDQLTPKVLCEKVANLLCQNGNFWVIWPISTSAEFEKTANENNLFAAKIITINGKPNESVRKIFNFTNSSDSAIEKQFFTIRNGKGGYTQEYKELTLEFHNKKL